jgi:hypothetical protein
VGLILHALDGEASENGDTVLVGSGESREPLDRLFEWFRGIF